MVNTKNVSLVGMTTLLETPRAGKEHEDSNASAVVATNSQQFKLVFIPLYLNAVKAASTFCSLACK